MSVFTNIEAATKAKSKTDNGLCAWFMLCSNQATQLISHPVLGQVMICDRCYRRAV